MTTSLLAVLKTSAEKSTQLILDNLPEEEGKVLALGKVEYEGTLSTYLIGELLPNDDILYKITKYFIENDESTEQRLFLEKGEDEEHITVYYPDLLTEITLKKDTVVTLNSFRDLFAVCLKTTITVEELQRYLSENTSYRLYEEFSIYSSKRDEFLSKPTCLRMSVCKKSDLPENHLEDVDGLIPSLLCCKRF